MHARLDWATVPTTLRNEINRASAAGDLCPSKDLVFRAAQVTPLADVKVVILGQDPYHTPGKASGLAFGYHPSYRGPVDSSLRNLFREVERDIGEVTVSRTLEEWAAQGVLLLNTSLTTLAGQPKAHQHLGWDTVVLRFLERIQDDNANMVFLLWGKEAHKYKAVINSPYNLALETSHPSAYSANRGFNGCSHFSKANEFLVQHGRKSITW